MEDKRDGVTAIEQFENQTMKRELFDVQVFLVQRYWRNKSTKTLLLVLVKKSPLQGYLFGVRIILFFLPDLRIVYS